MFREGGTVTTAAATTIREECERFFCESLAAAFLYGERNAAVPGSGLTGARDRRRSRRDGNAIRAYVSDTYGANTQDAHGDVMLANTPPDDHADGLEPLTATTSGGIEAIGEITAWLEFWDYAGGTGFRGFVGRPRGQEESTLFLFFTEELVGMELKQAYVLHTRYFHLIAYVLWNADMLAD